MDMSTWGDEPRPVSPGPAASHQPPLDPYEQSRLSAHLRDVDALTGDQGSPHIPMPARSREQHRVPAARGGGRSGWLWVLVAVLGAGVAVLLWVVAGLGAQHRSMLQPAAGAWASAQVRQV
jgi:hypothetical protein